MQSCAPTWLIETKHVKRDKSTGNSRCDCSRNLRAETNRGRVGAPAHVCVGGRMGTPAHVCVGGRAYGGARPLLCGRAGVWGRPPTPVWARGHWRRDHSCNSRAETISQTRVGVRGCAWVYAHGSAGAPTPVGSNSEREEAKSKPGRGMAGVCRRRQLSERQN